MTLWTLASAGLRHHWRAHVGVVLGAAVGCTVLVGALLVGSSVKLSLRALADQRLGHAAWALSGRDRFFREELAADMARALATPVAPVLQFSGKAGRSDGSARANRVAVLGVDERFAELGLEGALPVPGKGEVVLNERLARQLNAAPGDTLVLRVRKPSAVSLDAPLAPHEDDSVALRVTVKAVADGGRLGNFSLQANQVPPFNAFCALRDLQAATGLVGENGEPARANLLLGGAEAGSGKLASALSKVWTLADIELKLVPCAQGGLELRTGRIFFDAETEAVALKSAPEARGVLSYFVNEIRAGERATPYSMVTAMGAPVVPDGMKDGEILLNAWLAEDLGAKAGAEVELAYFVVGPMQKLEERRRRFTVRGVVPLEGAAADPALMPDFPGLAHTDNCKDWDPSFPIDLDRIRDKDETYWDDHRGTPKAFVTLAAGRAMWTSRFGALTAVRYPDAKDRETLAREIRSRLDPAQLGLGIVSARADADASTANALDFGPLFVGFSFFLIVAAVLLMALLFVFGVERRAEEVGVLLAVGFTPVQVRRVLMLEGAALALAGGAFGALAGITYAKCMLYGLATVWRDAVQTSALSFHFDALALVAGVLGGVAVCLIAVILAVRKQVRRPARELLSGSVTDAPVRIGRSRGRWVAIACTVAALGIVGALGARRDLVAAGGFFGAGALLLGAGLGVLAALLSGLRGRRGGGASFGVSVLAVRNGTRRRGRSLATAGLLACGSFLIVAIGAFRLDAQLDAASRASGTGGFVLLAQSALPIARDLNEKAVQEAYNFKAGDLEDVRIVPLRLRDGDDASCLNLSRAQQPQVWGVNPSALAERGAFSFAASEGNSAESSWLLLDQPAADGAVPCILDQNTAQWGLHKGVGEMIEYADGRGRPFNMRIVATVANSMLQGAVLVSEARFVEKFPSVSGYRIFLIDAPRERTEAVSAALSARLSDLGFEATPAPRRLAEFNAVQNTYLSTFQVLGGLGLLLGSIGLGVVVLRNVLERRGELALLRAVGFTRGGLRRMVFGEHGALLLAGLGIGVVAAFVAVIPALRAPGGGFPFASLSVTLAAVLLNGLLWTWGATVFALRGSLLDALRNE